MNTRLVGLFVIILFTIPAAILIGSWTATDPMMAAAALIGLVAMGALLALGKNIWMLIPAFYPFSEALVGAPLGFALRDIITIYVLVGLVMLWVVKRYKLGLQFSVKEGSLLAVYALLVFAFIRNPIGFAVFGSAKIGARPYIECFIALIVYGILSSQIVSMNKVRQSGLLWFLGGISSAVVQIVGSVSPSVGYYVSQVYQIRGGGALGGASASATADTGVGRLMYLKTLVRPLCAGLMAVTRPIGLLNPMKPYLFIGVSILVASALLSGFRSMLLWIAMMYIASAIVRRKKLDIVIAVASGLLVLSVLVAGNGSLFNLPISVQRSLSFIPGDWDYVATEDAEGSIEWRVEMWEIGMYTDEFIKNKIVGDGYGLTLDDMEYHGHIQTKPVVTHEDMQEFFMRSGDWHSGPVETIHRIGIVGLLVVTLSLIIFAKYAFRIMRKCENTGYYAPALFAGLPLLIYPFQYIFIYGTLLQAVTMMTMHGGMLRLIENSMGMAAED
ncbi:MAG: hypothetical protein ABGY95_12230 [Rubritalea sp.]|uniref:hypothetical protein n=1 Tax=Rubritalea sp. TaxID=2109375 RepID=UPI003241F6C6